jgi:hypothetical protein
MASIAGELLRRLTGSDDAIGGQRWLIEEREWLRRVREERGRCWYG